MMSSPHGGTLHPRHAFKYQMRSEISLNFSVNSVISFIAASTVFGGCRLNQQKRTQTPQHSLPARAFLNAKHAQLHSSSPKKELIIAIFYITHEANIHIHSVL